jgi:adenylosuccinate lyase
MAAYQDPLAKVGLTGAQLDGMGPSGYDLRTMHAFTPLEGRYAGDTEKLRGITSEFQSVKRRLGMEVEYLIALGDEFQQYNGPRKRLIERPFDDGQREALRRVYRDFSEADYVRFKAIEKLTDHDVVAIILLGLYKMGADVVDQAVMERAMHVGRTSSDMDTNVFSLMMHEIIADYYLPNMAGLQRMFIKKGEDWHKVPEVYGRPFTVIVAQTHEQPAVPTPLKKVLANIASAVDGGLMQFLERRPDGSEGRFRLYGKMGGAIGNDEAMFAAFPGYDWRPFYQKLLEGMGLEYQPVADQDESNMKLLRLLGIVTDTNQPIIKWCDDYSSYCSRGLIRKDVRKGQSGSSIMTQKVNPWRTEGGEIALMMADAELDVFKHLARQRKQGDLRRSYLKRYVGIPFANIGIAIGRIQEDLEKSHPNYPGIDKELAEHPEIASASMQMILRAEGVPGAYRMMVEKTRGRTVTADVMDSTVRQLVAEGTIHEGVGSEIRGVFKPENNVGDAVKAADAQLERAKDTLQRLQKAYAVSIS